MAKRFFYVCMGILALAVAYHLGAAKAESYTGSPFVSLTTYAGGGSTYAFLALTEDGTVYCGPNTGDPSVSPFPTWQVWGQIPTGATATQSTTWGQIKTQLGK
jgi:hypothetical protein